MPLPIDVNFYFNSTDKVSKNIPTNGQLKLCNPFIHNLAGDFLGGFHQCLRYMEALIAICRVPSRMGGRGKLAERV